MKNSEIKVEYERIIPQVLAGNMEASFELSQLLQNYTWTYSRLKNILTSHKTFLHQLITPFKPTDATLLGSLIHDIALEQDISQYVFEKVDGRTKAGKERKAEILEEGKVIVDPKVKEKADGAVGALLSHPEAKKLFKEDGKCEEWISFEHGGFYIGGFIDKELSKLTCELKTASDASAEKCMRDFLDRKYTLQARIYQMATSKEVIYPVVETSPPYNVSVFKCSPDYMAHGAMLLDKCLEELQELIDDLEQGILTTYNRNIIQHIQIPGWESKKLKEYQDR